MRLQTSERSGNTEADGVVPVIPPTSVTAAGAQTIGNSNSWSKRWPGRRLSTSMKTLRLPNTRDGIVTLSEIGSIWTINQQAKPLKTLASTLAVVGEFH